MSDWDEALTAELDAIEDAAREQRAERLARLRPLAEQQITAELVDQYGPDLSEWPEWKRPGSSEYEHRVDGRADWLHDKERNMQLWQEQAARGMYLPANVGATDAAIEVEPYETSDGVRERYVYPGGRRFPKDGPRAVELEENVALREDAVAREHADGGHQTTNVWWCADCLARVDGLERGPDAELQRTAADRIRYRIRFRLGFDVVAPQPEQPDRLTSGSAFLVEDEDGGQLWGGLWQSGEALTLVGPPGIGKTTLAQQVIGQAIDEEPDTVLGEQVACFDLVVYLAMDRPRQIARSLRRTLADADPELLDERLVVWSGPPPEDVAARPEALLELVQRAAGGDLASRRVAVVIDSLKDVAVGLVDDAVGASYNRARQLVLAAGVEVLELHHLVKRGANGAKPTSLADVYGSAWITAGAGSVVLLWGEPGDPVVELRHLKSPAGEVGPLRVAIDHTTGTASLIEGTDLLAMLRARREGLSAKAAAVALYDAEKPSSGQVEKARRQLDKLVSSGLAYRHEAPAGTRQATVWTALTASADLTVTSRDPFDEEGSR
ncbi:AAA family ATPase [Petropleomorpha daqingensis]|uniref:Energy-coupling factor transporter ATP-binding protein EcfA2 n=1 Tax=Petropleomorpha daqingensis TaxID=2026353 RepID=A0A853CKU2_9ACTN|nr:AAA family ATPase [Petropleomorpha daqingensis]NYJ06593.1 energy-coupling factor transporter ATP-binding protein EcfA2 [Petropleomorpha daqingensis]